MTSLRTGVTLQGVYPPDEFKSLVETIDALGYDYLWMTDSSLHSRNPYVYLAMAAGMSDRPTGVRPSGSVVLSLRTGGICPGADLEPARRRHVGRVPGDIHTEKSPPQFRRR